MYAVKTENAIENTDAAFESRYPERMTSMTPLVTEVWQQDIHDHDLWQGEKGVIVNAAALADREAYFEIIRVCINADKPPQLEA